MTLQGYIVILLPLLTPLIGSTLAAALAQDGWTAKANDGIAWAVLLSIAGIDMWANNQLTGGWLALVGDAVQAITLLSSGWLSKLSPWLSWLKWVQSNIFDLVPLLNGIDKIPVSGAEKVVTPARSVLP